MERREFFQLTGSLCSLWLLNSCTPKPQIEKYYVTLARFGSNQSQLRYFHPGFPSSPLTSGVIDYGWIGQQKSPVYKDDGSLTARGPIEKVFFAYNSFRYGISQVRPSHDTYTHLPTQSIEEAYRIIDPPLIFKLNGKLTVFRLEDDLSTSSRIYLTTTPPEFTKGTLSANGIYRVGEDGATASYLKNLQISLSPLKGAVVACLYEEYPVKIS